MTGTTLAQHPPPQNFAAAAAPGDPTDFSGRTKSSQGGGSTPRGSRFIASGLPVNNPLGLNLDP